MSRDVERTRIKEHLQRIRAFCDALEQTLDHPIPCSQEAQVIADTSIRLVTAAGRHDAFLQKEK